MLHLVESNPQIGSHLIFFIFPVNRSTNRLFPASISLLEEGEEDEKRDEEEDDENGEAGGRVLDF